MIAFVAAERREFGGIERLLQPKYTIPCGVDFAVMGTMNGRDVALVANGPGPKLAVDGIANLGIAKLEALVSTGFCGGLSRRLKAGDIFVATSVNGTLIPLPRKLPSAAQGALTSIDRVVTSAREKQSLNLAGGGAVEMEAAGLLALAQEKQTSFHCIRVVTDTADESFAIDFNTMRDETGRFSRGRIVRHALGRPWTFRELIRLDQRCRSAAKALGDFIAECEF